MRDIDNVIDEILAALVKANYTEGQLQYIKPNLENMKDSAGCPELNYERWSRLSSYLEANFGRNPSKTASVVWAIFNGNANNKD